MSKKDIKKVLETGKEIVKEANFGKIIRGTSRDTLLVFIEKFYGEKKSSKEDMAIAEEILKIAKGYYSYANDGEASLTTYFIKDEYYDKLLASFKQKGGVEPLPYIPANLKRVAPADESLVNFNMSRAYRVYEDEAIPNGVAEKESVESLVKAIYKEAGLKKDDKTTILLSPKIDGVGVTTSLKKGRFSLPTQKGQKEGKAILIKGLKGFELDKPVYDAGNVQYEVFITDSKRTKLSELLDVQYTNNRNTVAGVVTRLANSDDEDINEKLLKHLYFYPIIATETADGDNWKSVIDNLDSLGVLPKSMIDRKVFKGDRKEIIEAIQKYHVSCAEKRDSLDYNIDGIVVSFIDKEVRKDLGRKDGANQYQFAYKFNPYSTKVKVERIYQSFGKLGERSPMVGFEPAIIDGREFTEAAFKTNEEFNKFALAPGDEVILVITGDVIPTVYIDDSCERIENRSKEVSSFHVCEKCGVPLGGSDKRYVCENPNCPANITGKFAHFFEKIGIEYGISTAEDLYSITNSIFISDLLNVTEDQLKELGYKKKAKQFIKDLHKACKDLKDYEILGFMGLAKIQKKTARIILGVIPMKELLWMNPDDIIRKLKDVKGMGEVSAINYAKAIYQNRCDLRAMYEFIKPEETNFDEVKTVGFTGLTADDKLEELISELGWDTTDGKKFDYLITSSHNRESKKQERAINNGIPVFTREEFIEKFGK